MGCGAAKSTADVAAPGEEPISCSVTQIKDLAPLEVSDTGAHPPEKERRKPIKQLLTLPGLIPEPPGAEVDEMRKRESLIKMHPPKRPQRLEADLGILKAKSSEPEIQETIPEE
ncbi:uncharacterized protein [Parasteatoda tepidariorum]|uniref:uncharacterized protein n=1 Tax=Parasteatoda tepidariorum TaxID=114398 RepID=UPI00077FC8A5|nr:uncharacterized protein LOC107448300 [Parasteatoda tepidariorum]